MSQDAVFMSMVVAVGSSSKSFEEVRVDDYIVSYQTSGGPPPPVPQEPTDEIQRKALGLLPLFKPQSENTLAGGLPGTSSSALGSNVASSSLLARSSQGTSSKIVNPAEIPIGQEFKLYVVAAEKYHNIACMPEYEGFSPEELRYHAYFRGNITSPVPVTMDPFHTIFNETSTSSAPTVISEENLQSQCASPPYSRHSPEELRVAWMMCGREMTSNDLLGPLVPATPPAPSLSTTSLPPLIPLPVIATATPIAPKFNFVFK